MKHIHLYHLFIILFRKRACCAAYTYHNVTNLLSMTPKNIEIHKSAFIDFLYWHPKHKNFRHSLNRYKFENYFKQSRLKHMINGGCGVMVNHYFKYIYIRLPKTASHALLNALRWRESPHYLLAESYKGEGKFHQLSFDQIMSLWQDYFVFTVVRNPLSRAVSMYEYLTGPKIMKQTPACGGIQWISFCKDPYILGRFCESFPDCCLYNAIHQYGHVSPQVHCVMSRDRRFTVDFVARQESLAADVAFISREINKRNKNTNVTIFIPDKLILINENSENSSRNMIYYYQNDNGCFQNIMRIYGKDMSELNYLPS